MSKNILNRNLMKDNFRRLRVILFFSTITLTFYIIFTLKISSEDHVRISTTTTTGVPLKPGLLIDPEHSETRKLPVSHVFIVSAYYHPTSKSLGENAVALNMVLDCKSHNEDNATYSVMGSNDTHRELPKAPSQVFDGHLHIYFTSIIEPYFHLMREYERRGYITIDFWLRMKFAKSETPFFEPNGHVEWRNQAGAQIDCLLQYKEAAEREMLSPNLVHVQRPLQKNGSNKITETWKMEFGSFNETIKQEDIEAIEEDMKLMKELPNVSKISQKLPKSDFYLPIVFDCYYKAFYGAAFDNKPGGFGCPNADLCELPQREEYRCVHSDANYFSGPHMKPLTFHFANNSFWSWSIGCYQ
ncbi:hypothetical protein L3Y34_009386 [Caenorhabditis briggsae]|uniref:Glycosyltransferase family 92 protein n=1 Tax=Caenorhabditis briggsae TaxID=6238 RepID=A0AAE9D1W7_CAEBR|nr:hypothetical protein L3Y34_009386 [Caenorhabditis briggsae]